MALTEITAKDKRKATEIILMLETESSERQRKPTKEVLYIGHLTAQMPLAILCKNCDLQIKKLKFGSKKIRNYNRVTSLTRLFRIFKYKKTDVVYALEQ